ncbi:MAG: membrane protein insertion efficiency factor YidD [Deltaproteobacteria bacterium]|nr:membrane protein insertion efficiency factor YidD [Deltaproteobacteria bacterium]
MSRLITVSSKIALVLLTFLLCTGLDLNSHLAGHVLAFESDQDQSDAPDEVENGGFNLGAWFISSVWRHISAVDGQRCPSEPACSSYSARAFRKHGFFIGWVMTVDRLIHEADEGQHSPLVWRGGRPKIFDPVENNDFWWYGGNEDNRE